MKEVTVLVSAAGSTNGVNVIQGLRAQNDYDVGIVAIDSDSNAAGLYLADRYEIAPPVSAPAFKDFVLTVCKACGVDMIIPTHSVELPFFSSNQKLFSDWGVRTVISPLEKIKICDDKLQIAEFIRRLGVRHPKIYELNNIPDNEFPLFVKSRFGSGSAYARRVETGEELGFYIGRTPNPIVQEYISGTEYTVNVISDYNGRVVGLVPLRRVKVRGGLAVVAQVEVNPTIAGETRRIVEALGLVGPSNVQVIKDGEELVYLEVNPRFASGGMPLAAGAGFNIPLLLMKLGLGEPIGELDIEDGKKMIRFWDAIVV